VLNIWRNELIKRVVV